VDLAGKHRNPDDGIVGDSRIRRQLALAGGLRRATAGCGTARGAENGQETDSRDARLGPAAPGLEQGIALPRPNRLRALSRTCDFFHRTVSE
jgi:hypothetical protein